MALELIPIGTILAVLTNQVIKTAQAAKDVIFERESFKVLSKHLFDIESVLKELQLNELTDSPAVRLALESLEADVEKAHNLVEKYKKRSRFYLLIKCRHIVNEVQEVTRNIGRSLASVPLASTEVLSEISDQVNRLQNEMQRVELEASHSQLQIVDKLNQGLRDQKLDQGFANDMLEEIAKAVGVPVEPSEISKELASFRKEKEEASNRKERAEVLFLEQVIELLSEADAARDYEEVRKQYFQRLQVIERYDAGEDYISPLNPFVCPITMTVMVDPVSLCTGTTCERAAIEAWFDRGKRTDPETSEVLEDTSLRSNLPLRKSIQEWRELNHCLKIRCCREKLFSGEDASVDESLSQMQDLMRESSVNKDWISIGGLTDTIVSILGDFTQQICEEEDFSYLKTTRRRACKEQGPESSRILMVKALVNMELVDSNLELLGKEGIIPPLLDMVTSGNLQSKELSLSVLVKLSIVCANKELIAAAGGIPLVLQLMFSTHVRSIIIVKCSEILEKLSSDDDGIKFLVDENGEELDLEQIINNLLVLHQNINASHNVRRPALRALLRICKSEAGLVKTAVLKADGVSIVLPLLDDSDPEIRETAINLLFLFSHHEPEGVVDYLLKPKRLEALVGYLVNDDKSDVQMAAAGLLANLPKSELTLTMKLIDMDGLDAIIHILNSGTIEAKENALSALFRFTDPSNLESQRIVVKKGVYPLLVNFVRVGSVTAKARAAALIGTLSASTPMLTDVSKSTGCWCFQLSRVNLCSAHGGICSESTTFCLLKANALPDLVQLLHGRVHATAYEAIQTLTTLVAEGCRQRGANVLHEADAINPILDILNWGTDSLKEEALGLLEQVFMTKEMVEIYGSTTRLLLVGITGRNVHDDGSLGSKATRVLSLIERYSRSSTSLLPGLFG
ncbi:hypothetical protein Dsin_029739 [Dipteronia sinensis]|uniref:RING-type E3 ubiquitin transferase n=1 Tax=Dipteronia sinensis TaxID=43782 RepID=A0AAE0DVF8_9ROSI|nr:hypothetical protein Dsin_029739 [Dipteronia sinensis]